MRKLTGVNNSASQQHKPADLTMHSFNFLMCRKEV